MRQRMVFPVLALLGGLALAAPVPADDKEIADALVKNGARVARDSTGKKAVVAVEFTPAKRGEGLKEIAALPELLILKYGGAQVTDAEVKHLTGLKNLASLDLSGARLTDAGMKDIAALKKLLSLDIRSTRVTDAGLKELSPLTSLTNLNLWSTRVTGSGFRETQRTQTQNAPSARNEV